LSNAAGQSVVIASIGLLTNLAALLQSPPDKYSQLNGHALVAKKVKRLAVMGGSYPTAQKPGVQLMRLLQWCRQDICSDGCSCVWICFLQHAIAGQDHF
jgi:hypothetical protein